MLTVPVAPEHGLKSGLDSVTFVTWMVSVVARASAGEAVNAPPATAARVSAPSNDPSRFIANLSFPRGPDNRMLDTHVCQHGGGGPQPHASSQPLLIDGGWHRANAVGRLRWSEAREERGSWRTFRLYLLSRLVFEAGWGAPLGVAVSWTGAVLRAWRPPLRNWRKPEIASWNRLVPWTRSSEGRL